jgi:small subunit ribosomal protein S6e
MPFKLVIGDKGKAWKLDLDNEVLVGKSLGDVVQGKEIKAELEGYELEITGGSDSAGFPLSKEVPGLALKSILLKKGWGMRDSYPGIRKRKTVRGKVLSASVSQINLKVVKSGSKHLAEIFPDQNKPKEEKKEGKPKAEGEAVAAPAA